MLEADATKECISPSLSSHPPFTVPSLRFFCNTPNTTSFLTSPNTTSFLTSPITASFLTSSAWRRWHLQLGPPKSKLSFSPVMYPYTKRTKLLPRSINHSGTWLTPDSLRSGLFWLLRSMPKISQKTPSKSIPMNLQSFTRYVRLLTCLLLISWP